MLKMAKIVGVLIKQQILSCLRSPTMHNLDEVLMKLSNSSSALKSR